MSVQELLTESYMNWCVLCKEISDRKTNKLYRFVQSRSSERLELKGHAAWRMGT